MRVYAAHIRVIGRAAIQVIGAEDNRWQNVQQFRLLGSQQVNQQVEYVSVLLSRRAEYILRWDRAY